jgi:medium-chain acyl-[acyl-carrier-protein] hydrolase
MDLCPVQARRERPRHVVYGEKSVGSTWINFSKTNAGKINFFCFPYSGGSAQAYLGFQEALCGYGDVYALELPGRGRNFLMPGLDCVSAMVDYAMGGLVPLIHEKPFAFFGHSLGGILSYEMTHALRKNNMPVPRHIFISSMTAPGVVRLEPQLENISDSDLVYMLTTLGGMAPEIVSSREMLELFIPIIRCDLKAVENYVSKETIPLDIPLSIFFGKKDVLITGSDINKWRDNFKVCSVHEFDGDHFCVFSDLRKTAEIILQKLCGDSHCCQF